MSAKKPYFDSVNLKENFPAMEKKILDNWYKKGIVKKYLKRNKNSKKYFSFLDGPITANNPMGVHHAWGRTYKDLWQRYYNMKGFKQRFQNGFDCQGLWVEVEVEKELGLKNKKDIENLVPQKPFDSVAKFVNLCKARVLKFADIQTQQSKRLGYFMDWDNSYYTMSNDNNYMIWHFLKTAHKRGLVYKGRDAVPWCPRCGTAISQHEILTEDYKTVAHKSIYFKLPLRDNKKEFLLVWTTTPWTIPGNTAVAVNKDLDYSLVEESPGGDCLWVAKELVKKIFDKNHKKIQKTTKGLDLVGLKYQTPFDTLPVIRSISKDHDNFHKVVATDEKILPVTTEEGTGLVHIATGAGTEDHRLGKKLNLPILPVIEENAQYLKGFGWLSGKNAKKHPELILDYLSTNSKKETDWVYKIESYSHKYPTCWRCKTELVWRVVDEWYISTEPIREDMKNVAKRTRWIPKFGLKRELDWLNNMDDWLISKKRFWGLALPIWECKCGHFEVIGGLEELKQKAIEGWKDFEGNTPHRPWIDKVKIKCNRCDKPMTRIPDVGTPWLDAGIVPFSTISKDNKSAPLYKINRKEWEKWFPVDFITESFPGQFKNWFYAVIAMSTVLENKEAFKTCLGFATLLAEDGRPMHKSWGNSIEFNEGADKIGVDVMRWMFARQNYADNMLFGYKTADEIRRQFHLKLWNIYNFFVTYANLDNWTPNKNISLSDSNLSVLDQWILSRLEQTTKDVTKALDDFEAKDAAESLESFVEDLSNWYIRRSRQRVAPWQQDREDKNAFYQTCYFVIVTLSKLLAPFTPFLAEKIFKNLTKEESVHLSDWPAQSHEINQKLLSDMNNLRLAVEDAHSQRKQKGIPVRQSLSSLTSTLPFNPPDKSLHYLLLDELNVKAWVIKKGPKISSHFDTKLTPQLKEESLARELIRKIQSTRKEMQVDIKAKVNVQNNWLPKSSALQEFIRTRAGVEKLTKGPFKITLKK